jgi:hypothetical protein
VIDAKRYDEFDLCHHMLPRAFRERKEREAYEVRQTYMCIARYENSFLS